MKAISLCKDIYYWAFKAHIFQCGEERCMQWVMGNMQKQPTAMLLPFQTSASTEYPTFFPNYTPSLPTSTYLSGGES